MLPSPGFKQAVQALGALLCTGAFAGTASSSLADEIPDVPGAGATPAQFTGSPAVPYPVFGADPPRHPFMAPNGASNIHNDAYQTDAYQGLGPLGRDMRKTSTYLNADCASVTFDKHGRIVSNCVGIAGPTLRILDPKTLATLDSMTLPGRDLATTDPTKLFTDFSGGGYFYLDDQDRAVLGTYSRHMLTVTTADEKGAPRLRIVRDVDLNGVVPSNDKLISALPDFSGRLWFITTGGIVGTIDRDSAKIAAVDTREHNGNSFAVGEAGEVYVVTDAALYRYEADPTGKPVQVWRQSYDNVGSQKSGQTQAGSGTTPTLMEDGLITITDNADPMNVVVYKRAKTVEGSREVCRIAVFAKGASSSDNSLIVARRSIIVENNYGYAGPQSVEFGATTTPGIERVDVDPVNGTCTRVWHSDEISPTLVPKLSLAAGLVYAYTKPVTQGTQDPWYLTALDFRTGKTVYKYRAGGGLGFNNNYAPVTLGPDGTAYVGVLGGLVAMRDATPPVLGEPRIEVTARRSGRSHAFVTLSGRDTELARRVEVLVAGRKRGEVSVPPFEVRVAARRRAKILVRVLLADGRTVQRRLRG